MYFDLDKVWVVDRRPVNIRQRPTIVGGSEHVQIDTCIRLFDEDKLKAMFILDEMPLDKLRETCYN